MEFVVGPITEADEVWFVPDFANNRQLPSENQAQVRIRPLTGRELKKVQNQLALKGETKNDDMLSLVSARLDALNRKVILKGVTGLKNWFRVENGERKEVTTAEGLVDTIESARNAAAVAILGQIADAITSESALNEGDAKNFDGSSDG